MRNVAVAVLTAGLISGLTAACSSSTGSSASRAAISSAAMSCSSSKASAASGSGDPLAKLTGAEIMKQAEADAYAAATLCVSEPVQLYGTSLKVTSIAAVVLGKTERCAGMVTTPGGGVGTLTVIGSDVLVMANQAYARSVKGNTPETVSAQTGKYVTAPHTVGAIVPVLNTCHDATVFVSSMTALGPYHRIAGSTQVDGQPAVTVTDSMNDSWYIADTARPLPLRVVVATADNAVVDFSSFGAKFAMSPPPASQVIDGSKYGF